MEEMGATIWNFLLLSKSKSYFFYYLFFTFLKCINNTAYIAKVRIKLEGKQPSNNIIGDKAWEKTLRKKEEINNLLNGK